jgi:hypothetical protein
MVISQSRLLLAYREVKPFDLTLCGIQSCRAAVGMKTGSLGGFYFIDI